MQAERSNGTPCRICGWKTRSLWDEPCSLWYHRCLSCDFLFVEERGFPSPEEERAEYLKHDNHMGNPGYVRFLESFIRKGVRPFLGSARTALDFGCGPGPVLAHLLEQCGLAVDIYDPFFFPDKVYRGKRYDLITATEVLEHIRDPRESFRELKNHLGENGILSIMTRFHPMDDEAFLSWWYRREQSHISFFSPVTLSFLAHCYAMEVVWTDGCAVSVIRPRSRLFAPRDRRGESPVDTG